MHIDNIIISGLDRSIKQCKAVWAIFRTLSITYGTEKYPIVPTGIGIND